MDVKYILTIIIFLLIVDIIWVGYISKPMWDRLVLNVQNSPLEANSLYAGIAYMILISGLILLVADRIRPDSWIKDSLYYGIIYGLVVYGLFDFTNLAIFKNYSLKVSLIDMTWGAFISSVTLLVANYFRYN